MLQLWQQTTAVDNSFFLSDRFAAMWEPDIVLHRRTFLLAGSAGLAAMAAAPQPSQRRVFSLNRNWLFSS
jgi:hypothetical protein